MKHLILFDGQCGLCDRCVRFFLWADKKRRFQFTPLQGETAKQFDLDPKEDSMVLIEEDMILYEGVAALRALWLVGGVWSVFGVLYFILPSFLVNNVYRLVARNRHKLFSSSCTIHQNDPRFLP